MLPAFALVGGILLLGEGHPVASDSSITIRYFFSNIFYDNSSSILWFAIVVYFNVLGLILVPSKYYFIGI